VCRAAALLVATTAACSFGLTGPAPHAPDDVPHCTTSGLLPALDTVAAASDLVGGAYVAYEYGFVRSLPSFAVGAIYAAAAAYGNHTVAACRRATDAAVGTLVAEATTAMNTGGCSQVLEIAVHLAQDAPDSYVVFIHDPAFASCF
jgi:hypothetical protein